MSRFDFTAPQTQPGFNAQSTVSVAPKGNPLKGLYNRFIFDPVSKVIERSVPVQVAARMQAGEGFNQSLDSATDNSATQVKIAAERSQIAKDLQAQGKSKEEATRIAQTKTTRTEKELIGNAVLGTVGIPEGEAGNIFSGLARETNPKVIAPILKNAGVQDDLIEGVTQAVSKAKTADEVKGILQKAADFQQATKLSTAPNLVHEIAQSKDPAYIARLLKESDVSPELIPEVSQKLANVSSEKSVQATLDTVKNLEANAKASAESSLPKIETRLPEETAAEPLSQSLPEAGQIVPPHEVEPLTKMVEDKAPSVKNKVNIVDYFRTPENVLKKIGLGKQAQELRGAYESYQGQLRQEVGRIAQWEKEAPDPASSQRIFQWLDGQSVQLAPNEQKVANEVKTYLQDWAEKLNLPQDKRISNYITHIFERDFINKEFDPELAKIIEERIPGSVYDPFLEKRLGKLGYVEDTWRALEAYVKRATRKYNMDPALDSLRSAADLLDLESYKYVKRYAERVNLRPTELDNLLDNAIKSSPIGYKFGQRPTTVLTQKFRQMVYWGALGLNIGSALKNLTQGVNTYAKLGEKYTILGYSDLAKRMIAGDMEELYKSGVLDDAFIQDRKLTAIKSVMQKLDKVLFSLFDTAEKINRGSAYFGAKKKALDLGMSEVAAISYAKRIVRETQFAFGSIDNPIVLSSDLSKTLLQFQTFNVKQAEFLTGMIKNKEFGGLARWIGASLVSVYTIGKLFGMRPQDLIPTVRLGGSPLVNALSSASEAAFGNPQQKAEGKKGLINTGTLLIPAGVQAKKTIQGVSQYQQGRATTAAGKTKYKVEKSTSNLIRGSLFGPNSFPETQNYYDKPGSKKATPSNRFAF
jgi:hypothetical protein